MSRLRSVHKFWDTRKLLMDFNKVSLQWFFLSTVYTLTTTYFFSPVPPTLEPAGRGGLYCDTRGGDCEVLRGWDLKGLFCQCMNDTEFRSRCE